MRVELPGGASVPPPTFKNLITELASTALVCLGVIASPITRQKALDLERAKHLIGLLDMLATKTTGNLRADENEYLEAVLEDLKIKYEQGAGVAFDDADDDGSGDGDGDGG
jgi:hypothetical protein